MARRPGTLNQRTKERLAELRRKMALGLSYPDIQEQMSLTPKEWRNLLQRHFEGAGFEGTIYYWGNFQARKAFQYQELVRALQHARGLDNPLHTPRLRPGDPGYEPRYLAEPNPKAVAAIVRAMAVIDQQSAEIGVRLGVLPAVVLGEAGQPVSGGPAGEWRRDDPRTWSFKQLLEYQQHGKMPDGPERQIGPGSPTINAKLDDSDGDDE